MKESYTEIYSFPKRIIILLPLIVEAGLGVEKSTRRCQIPISPGTSQGRGHADGEGVDVLVLVLSLYILIPRV